MLPGAERHPGVKHQGDAPRRGPARVVRAAHGEARANQLLGCTDAERSTWLRFTDDERRALTDQDHVALFQLGAHPFLTLTLFIALFERDHGPLEYQKAYGRAMAHLSLPYPDIAT